MATSKPGRRLVVGLAVFCCVVSSGCAGGVGDISGKITYKGKPVVYGTVGFVGADGLPRSSRINPDGTYTVKDVAAGEAKITIDSPQPVSKEGSGGGGGRQKGRDAAKEKDAPKDAPKVDRGGGREEAPEYVDPQIAKNWVQIPPSYGDVAKTKLRFTVRKGPNTYDIILD